MIFILINSFFFVFSLKTIFKNCAAIYLRYNHPQTRSLVIIFFWLDLAWILLDQNIWELERGRGEFLFKNFFFVKGCSFFLKTLIFLLKGYVQYLPIVELKATPTPHRWLLGSMAISPAQRVPWLAVSL